MIVSPWQMFNTCKDPVTVAIDFNHARTPSPGQLFNTCKDPFPMAIDFNLMAGRLRNLLGTHYRLSVEVDL